MKMNHIATVFFGVGLVLAGSAQASDHVIRFDETVYSSPASALLGFVQGSLAAEAIKTCGNKNSVVGLSRISIQINRGIGSPVAVIGPSSNTSKANLDLIYPRLSANAIVQCRE